MDTPADEHGSPKDAPAFPAEAVDWLVGGSRRMVVSLAPAYVTAALAAAGHHVSVVTLRSPGTVDTIVASNRLPDDLEALAQLLRSGGRLTLVCSQRDHRIPWVRKLDALIGAEAPAEPAAGLIGSRRFGFVEDTTFSYWQVVNQVSLAALLRAELAGLAEHEREAKVAAALTLYADYGRGNDGMQMPWVSRCYRATVVDEMFAAEADDVVSTSSTTEARPTDEERSADDGRRVDEGGPVNPETSLFDSAAEAMLLIDFR